MSKNYEEQSHQSLPAQATYWFKLPTPNRTYLDFLFETDEEKAIKEFEKFVDIIEKKKVKEKDRRKMPDSLVIGTIAVCIFIFSQIAIRSKK